MLKEYDLINSVCARLPNGIGIRGLLVTFEPGYKNPAFRHRKFDGSKNVRVSNINFHNYQARASKFRPKVNFSRKNSNVLDDLARF